ncbi:TIGR01777 family oxidoreductase [Pedobacter sp. MW01-1-1]|uniref:TIGR01777 family oxidoreductase n=1 Tax=Pedobacter sp. MW01-1-1 TaxID=3383027 RepID=UPI003FF054E0
MVKKVLISGSTGLIGKALTEKLLLDGYELNLLTRKKSTAPNTFFWNVKTGEIDLNCLSGVDAIIHLAGEPIMDKKWTVERKKLLISSRVKSTELLLHALKSTPNHQVKTFISASGVGYYGDCGDEILTENNPVGYGFLAECCRHWEQSVEEGKKYSLRTVQLRTGIVLARGGGALEQLALPIKLFAGAALGTGKQWIPWIHIDDIVALYHFALCHPNLEGAFNACAPFPVTHFGFTKALAKQLKRPVWPFSVPSSVIKKLLGARSEALLMSTNTSAQKALNAGFNFKFTYLSDALNHLYQKQKLPIK